MKHSALLGQGKVIPGAQLVIYWAYAPRDWSGTKAHFSLLLRIAKLK